MRKDPWWAYLVALAMPVTVIGLVAAVGEREWLVAQGPWGIALADLGIAFLACWVAVFAWGILASIYRIGR